MCYPVVLNGRGNKAQNLKNLKPSVDFGGPGERLIQNFLVGGPCVTGVISLARFIFL